MNDLINAAVEKLNLPEWARDAVDHNRYLAVAILAIGLMVGTVAGCQPTVPSPLTGKPVDRHTLHVETTLELGRLQGELEALKARSVALAAATEASVQELDRKQAMVASALEQVGAIAGPAAGPWGGLVTGALGLLSIGLGLDNRRKDGLLAKGNADGKP